MKPADLRKQVEAFDAELERELSRRQKARDQLKKVCVDLADADPDTAGFVKLIAERDAAQARVTAFDVRVERVSEQIKTSRAELVRVEAADLITKTELARHALASSGANLNAIAAKAREDLIAAHCEDFSKRLAEFVELYNSLSPALREEIGSPVSATPWGGGYVGNDILETAARLSRGAP